MTLLFAFPEQAAMGVKLIALSGYKKGDWTWRQFPDGESYVRILSDVKGKQAIILCSLSQPDTKTLPLIFLAKTLKELGCEKVTLFAPYLGYMRQDIRFHEGEAITSEVFAEFLSRYIDALVTVDPHLHRHKHMEEIYACECKVLSAAPLMAQWVTAHVKNPLIIGPDGESEQWVKMVAAQSNAPYVVSSKGRHGDRDIELVLPDIRPYKDKTPVLIDDIISTGVTVIRTIELLRQQGHMQVVCLATHGVFAGDAYEKIMKMGNVEAVTSDTISHPSNAIDVASLFA
ncbi:MAG: ribose-phosphate diphosphokinase [Alphaproteobacteria bacterium]